MLDFDKAGQRRAAFAQWRDHCCEMSSRKRQAHRPRQRRAFLDKHLAVGEAKDLHRGGRILAGPPVASSRSAIVADGASSTEVATESVQEAAEILGGLQRALDHQQAETADLCSRLAVLAGRPV